jgi:predicted glycogen debranching enzyme
VLAADQFVITPVGRLQDMARAHAAGDEVRTVIAGYHWFTDWGRDTMISLEGLTLSTGRHMEAGWILRTFAYYVRDGLIPNMFPEGENEGLYHTADATLWFFHALDRYVEATRDRATLKLILPKLVEVVQRHIGGTRFGIGVDKEDGLLGQGAEGYQLTWMDAKVEGWVVTPRRGKAVELNALWYNALRLLEAWAHECECPIPAADLAAMATRVRESFNQKFWNPETGCCFDVIEGEDGGNDSAVRPNQLCWEQVVAVCRDRLLTPVGLRSLAPGHPDYKSRYYGDLRSRDAAYHQGTVWAWLIGPFIDAWLKVYPQDKRGARQFLSGFEPHMTEGAIGSISEIFDSEAPYTQRGCIAQAWSVAEVLRCWVKSAE